MSYLMRDEWEMEFAESGLEALDCSPRRPSMSLSQIWRMPGMDGAHCCTRCDSVTRRWSALFCPVIRTRDDPESVGQSHQYLAPQAVYIETLLRLLLALRSA